MAARPDFKPEKCTFVYRVVETATTVTVGAMVKDGNADGECQPCGAKADLCIGIVTALGTLAGAAGDRVQIALASGGIVPVKVGAGGATAGQWAKYVSATAVCDAAPVAAATGTACMSPGYFMQTGVSGDIVGLALCRAWFTEA